MVAAVLLGNAVAGCGSEPDPLCREAAGATVCVAPQGSAYRIEGRGFQPGSEARLGGDGGGEDKVFQVGPDGGLPPPGAVMGFLPGPGSAETHITGTSSSGQPVSFTIVCEPTGQDDTRCTPRFV